MKKEKIKFWLLVVGLLAWLLFSVFTFVYFKTECKVVQENPLKYSAERYDVDLCTCLTTTGTTFFFNKTRVWSVKRGIVRDFGLSNLTEKLNFSNIDGG